MINSAPHKYISIALTILNIVLCSSYISASSIYGLVKDNTDKAIEVATVSLFRTSDSTLVKAELTDVDGKFSFVEIPAGEYFIRVSFLGYAEYATKSFSV